MKTISKLLAILLVLALIFSLVACGDSKKSKNRDDDKDDSSKSEVEEDDDEDDEEDDTEEETTEAEPDPTEPSEAPASVVGTWKYGFDVTKFIGAMAEKDEENLSESFISFMTKMFEGETFVLVMDLGEDNTFVMSIDEEEMQKTLESVKARSAEYAPELLAYVCEISGTTVEEFEALMTSQGITMDDFAAMVSAQIDVEQLLKQMTEKMTDNKGTYLFENGELNVTMEDGEQITYMVELDSDTLTILDAVGANVDIPEELLPWIFTK